MPYIQQWLGSSSQYLQPQLSAIQQQGENVAAQTQSAMGARGLRGSDIEAAGILGARQGAAQNMAQVQAQYGMNQANQMAQYIMQSLGMDIQSNQQMYLNLAQALGQQMTNEQNAREFQQQLEALKKGQTKQMWGSIIGGALGAASRML